MLKKLSTGLIFLFFALTIGLNAQENKDYQSENLLYQSAKDLFYKKKFASAQKLFEQILEQESDENSELSVAASYHRAVCALELFNRDAEYLLKDFLKKHPDSRWNEDIYFQLGTYSYRKKDHEDVVNWLSKVNPDKLAESEKTAYYFKLGFSYFNIGEKRKALGNFTKIKNVQGDYFYPSNYYYGHLNYEEGRYQNALESFERIQQDDNFKDLVPYYIVHIYYHQKKYDELIAYATPLLANEDLIKKEEVARLVGEAYYYEKDYEKALPYLKSFADAQVGRSDEDNYQLGYCYYKVGKHREAVKYFNYVSNLDNEMGQIANYHLAECYLALDDKKTARQAFKAASKYEYNKRIQEDALFNFAKLAYELSYNPYHEAITAFEDYLNRYPKSPRVDEVNEILIYVYLTTRNYEAALESIEKIDRKDFRLRSAFQYLAYNRGVELFLAKDYRAALANFKKVGMYQIEKKLISSSLFWQGECYYQLANYPNAAGAYSRFIKQGDAYGTGFYNQALYNLGYCYFKQERFDNAKKYFRDFVSSKANLDPALLGDGLTRLADCYYVDKEYSTAADYYAKASKMGGEDQDYARYQLALCQGFDGNQVEKIATLKNFTKKFPESAYTQDALFELGDAYFKNQNNEEALDAFNSLVSNYPSGELARKALLKSGLILYRNKQVDEALATFKRVAASYPNYADAKEAIQRAEDIYVELGRIEEYNEWVEGMSFANISQTSLDSVNFRAAENFFAKEDCEGAVDAFEKYLNKFEPAIFATNAHFYMAECFYRKEAYDLAKVHYDYIVNQTDNKYTEPALITVAYLNFLDSNYQVALEQYKRLENLASFKTNRIQAKIGQMRCYKELDLARETMDYANKVLFYSGIPEDIRIEALLAKGNAEKRLNRLVEAYNTYDSLASFTKSIEGAEARYHMADIKYKQGLYSDAEEQIFQAINTKPTYDFWMAKTFLLLSDVYIAFDDLFQAKATLQSIIDYHEGEDLVREAQIKLDKILAKEAKENEGEKEEVEIQFKPGDEAYEKLYDEGKEVKPTTSDTTKAKIIAPEPTVNDSLKSISPKVTIPADSTVTPQNTKND